MALESAWLVAFRLELPIIFCQRHSNQQRRHARYLPSLNASLNSKVLHSVPQQWYIGTTRIVQNHFEVHYYCNTALESWQNRLPDCWQVLRSADALAGLHLFSSTLRSIVRTQSRCNNDEWKPCKCQHNFHDRLSL